MNDVPPKPSSRWLRFVATGFACLAILAAAVTAVVVINRTEPTAQTINATRKSEALVDTVTANRGTYAPRLAVLGTVRPASDIVLSPRVSGQVSELSSAFTPGGMVQKGDLLLSIDPADFENAISIRESELKQAEASREIERARQDLAKKELKLLEGSIGNTNRGLVMREPQIASIEAEVSAAKAALDRAKLDLERTSIYAPFDAQVLSRSANVGSQVSPGDELARLVGLDEYWVMAAVPVRNLRWIRFSDKKKKADIGQAAVNSPTDAAQENTGSKVTLRDPDAWGAEVTRSAHVKRMIGTLDEQTRLARVLITVDDPLGRTSDAPPLILNTLIETEIEGQPIEDVVRLRRDLVRDQDTVWVMADGKLQIRNVEIVFRDADFAYIGEGLDDGDTIVTTTLATVADGVGLRRATDSSAFPTSESANEPDGTKAAPGEAEK